MFYTITLSPSIDHVVIGKTDFVANGLNRYETNFLFPGGKGINAAIVLQALKMPVKAITFLKGLTGQLFTSLTNHYGLEIITFATENETRINTKFLAQNAFELNGPRAQISSLNFDQLLKFITTKIKPDDFIFVMGLGPEDLLHQLLAHIEQLKIPFALDLDSVQAIDLFQYKPFMIKPNLQEIQVWFKDLQINQQSSLLKAMLKLQAKGAQNVLLSMGADGAYFLSDQGKFFQLIIKEKLSVVSTVGAGDTLLAAFCSAYYQTKEIPNSLKTAGMLAADTVMQFHLTNGKLNDAELANIIEVKEIIKPI